MWPFKKTPEELYKQKQTDNMIENIKCGAWDVSGRSISRLGYSEYGAQKLLEQGKEPTYPSKVLTEGGDLISWEEWRAKNEV